MNCEEARHLAALAASDDVSGDERSDLREHLAACLGCRGEAAEFAELTAGLAELREDAVPAAAYATVRGRVVGRLTRRGRWRLWPAAAALVAACALWIALVHQRKGEAAKPLAYARGSEIASVAPVPVPAPRRRARRVRKQAEPEAEPLVVKMFTDDPQVVIYWIAGGKGSNQ